MTLHYYSPKLNLDRKALKAREDYWSKFKDDTLNYELKCWDQDAKGSEKNALNFPLRTVFL